MITSPAVVSRDERLARLYCTIIV